MVWKDQRLQKQSQLAKRMVGESIKSDWTVYIEFPEQHHNRTQRRTYFAGLFRTLKTALQWSCPRYSTCTSIVLRNTPKAYAFTENIPVTDTCEPYAACERLSEEAGNEIRKCLGLDFFQIGSTALEHLKIVGQGDEACVRGSHHP